MPPHKLLASEDIWPLGSSPLSSESPSILCKQAVSYFRRYLTGLYSDRNVASESVQFLREQNIYTMSQFGIRDSFSLADSSPALPTSWRCKPLHNGGMSSSPPKIPVNPSIQNCESGSTTKPGTICSSSPSTLRLHLLLFPARCDPRSLIVSFRSSLSLSSRVRGSNQLSTCECPIPLSPRS